MAEYIDKDKFCHYLFKHIATFAENMIQMPVASTLQSVVNEIHEFQSEDVQLVVRCKDCKHFHLDYFGEVNGANIIVAHEICDLWAGGCKTTQDTFCSNGVRKDGEA